MSTPYRRRHLRLLPAFGQPLHPRPRPRRAIPIASGCLVVLLCSIGSCAVFMNDLNRVAGTNLQMNTLGDIAGIAGIGFLMAMVVGLVLFIWLLCEWP